MERPTSLIMAEKAAGALKGDVQAIQTTAKEESAKVVSEVGSSMAGAVGAGIAAASTAAITWTKTRVGKKVI